MNRRAFLSFLSVAPVAGAMAASGAMTAPTIQTLHVKLDTSALMAKVNLSKQLLQEVWITANEARLMFGLRPIEWTARDSSVIGTAETQAHVSTESEKQFPTAIADDLCHSAQDTETLSPKLDRRLRRSWGAYVDEGRARA